MQGGFHTVPSRNAIARVVTEAIICKRELECARHRKGRFEAREGWSEAEPFCITVACRSVLAGRPGQRRCDPVVTSKSSGVAASQEAAYCCRRARAARLNLY